MATLGADLAPKRRDEREVDVSLASETRARRDLLGECGLELFERDQVLVLV